MTLLVAMFTRHPFAFVLLMWPVLALLGVVAAVALAVGLVVGTGVAVVWGLIRLLEWATRPSTGPRSHQ